MAAAGVMNQRDQNFANETTFRGLSLNELTDESKKEADKFKEKANECFKSRFQKLL